MGFYFDVVRDEGRPLLRGDAAGNGNRAFMIGVVCVEQRENCARIPENASHDVHASRIACLSRAPGAWPPLRPAPTRRKIGWLSAKGGRSPFALLRAAFRMVVRRTRRRPPRRTLGSSPRWSRRQSVERDTPNAWIASPIVSRFVDIARSYHGSLTVSLVSFQRGQVPPRVRSHCSSRVPQVSRCSRPGWWQLRRECPSLENRQTWGTQRGAPWVTSDCNGRHHYQVFFWFQIRTGAHSKCQGTTEEQMQSIDKTVHQFYAARGISPLRFTCEHYSNCRNGCRTFAQAREPFIGRRYGEHGAPRLLFVSSNPPKGDMAGESRTIQAVRRSEETECHQDLPKQLHWYRTHEFAWRLLQHVLPKRSEEHK